MLLTHYISIFYIGKYETNSTKEVNIMTKIFNYPLHTQISGLYAEPFYTAVDLEPFELRDNPDYLEIPEFLVQKEYREYTGHTRKHIDFNNLSSKDEDIYIMNASTI